MSDTELTANDLISLGVNLSAIGRPEDHIIGEYHGQANSFVALLRKAKFRNTLYAAEPMLQQVERMEEVHGVGFFESRKQLAATAYNINHVLQGEAQDKTLILTDAKPADAIAQLTGLQPHQQALLQDLVTCLKAHVARPAIVVAWALGYDIVRWWIHSDAQRLLAFNTQLKNQTVTKYEDFFDIGEKTVLVTCRNAQNALKDFSENTYNALFGLLNDRNCFAHANFTEATINRANVFVEKVVETVTGQPFT